MLHAEEPVEFPCNPIDLQDALKSCFGCCEDYAQEQELEATLQSMKQGLTATYNKVCDLNHRPDQKDVADLLPNYQKESEKRLASYFAKQLAKEIAHKMEVMELRMQNTAIYNSIIKSLGLQLIPGIRLDTIRGQLSTLTNPNNQMEALGPIVDNNCRIPVHNGAVSIELYALTCDESELEIVAEHSRFHTSASYNITNIVDVSGSGKTFMTLCHGRKVFLFYFTPSQDSHRNHFFDVDEAIRLLRDCHENNKANLELEANIIILIMLATKALLLLHMLRERPTCKPIDFLTLQLLNPILVREVFAKLYALKPSLSVISGLLRETLQTIRSLTSIPLCVAFDEAPTIANTLPSSFVSPNGTKRGFLTRLLGELSSCEYLSTAFPHIILLGTTFCFSDTTMVVSAINKPRGNTQFEVISGLPPITDKDEIDKMMSRAGLKISLKPKQAVNTIGRIRIAANLAKIIQEMRQFLSSRIERIATEESGQNHTITKSTRNRLNDAIISSLERSVGQEANISEQSKDIISQLMCDTTWLISCAVDENHLRQRLHIQDSIEKLHKESPSVMRKALLDAIRRILTESALHSHVKLIAKEAMLIDVGIAKIYQSEVNGTSICSKVYAIAMETATMQCCLEYYAKHSKSENVHFESALLSLAKALRESMMQAQKRKLVEQLVLQTFNKKELDVEKLITQCKKPSPIDLPSAFKNLKVVVNCVGTAEQLGFKNDTLFVEAAFNRNPKALNVLLMPHPDTRPDGMMFVVGPTNKIYLMLFAVKGYTSYVTPELMWSAMETTEVGNVYGLKGSIENKSFGGIVRFHVLLPGAAPKGQPIPEGYSRDELEVTLNYTLDTLGTLIDSAESLQLLEHLRTLAQETAAKKLHKKGEPRKSSTLKQPPKKKQKTGKPDAKQTNAEDEDEDEEDHSASDNDEPAEDLY